ncbi:Smr domain-containing protein [Bernardetia litoralis DSM 6794]|uniref:Smr domain-containing protein n=1 Tax=Bernardetia litoralis (strain ATCC 23117 / DSM 6794 / NBRC 15988 / NCIMB 1366 / Fx l1 / Sio-4) TaxID=880071 RepID=I4APZ4_BERLS|nr:Smr/MutS family protein [Bernardetia litoralis]AFM06029.1 Smr domain-containing protein [Bernardetia litoralis DSM 6794]
MKIGDKVRMLSGTEEGVITKILQNGQVEVEIEDGFALPVMAAEIVIIHKQEEKYFGKKSPVSIEEEKPIFKPTKKVKKSTVGEGIYLAFTDFNDKLLNVYLINNLSYSMLVTVSEQLENGHEKHLFSEQIDKENAPRIHRLSREDFNDWKPLIIKAIFFKDGNFEPKETLIFTMGFNNSFFRIKRTAPVLERESYLFRVEGREVQPDLPTEKLEVIDVNSLRERIIENSSKVSPYKTETPPSEIDLHIEELSPDHYDVMTNEAIITMQLEHFELYLDKALASNMKSIIFIHGIGTGKLRLEIHRRLSQHPHVKYYQDAYKDKFGYGATKAVFQ